MQGFQTKYYLCEAERGDFVGNRQATTLHARKTWQVPLRHNSHQADRKLICEAVEVHPVWMVCKGGDYGVKKGLQRKEKIRRDLSSLLAVRSEWENGVIARKSSLV